MVEGGGHRLRVAGHVHQARLHGRGDGDAGADGEQVDRRQPDIAAGISKGGQGGHVPQQHAEDGPQARAVGQPAADQIAYSHADTDDGQQDRDDQGRYFRDFQQGGRDKRVDGEHAAEADRHHQQGQPHLQAAEHAQFAARAGIAGSDHGHEDAHHQHGQQAQRGDEQKGRAPAQGLADVGGQRHAEDICHRQTHQHAGDGLAAPVRFGQGGRHQGCHAEIRAMRDAGHEAGHDEQAIVGGDGAEQVATSEHQHQADQHQPARHARQEDRDQGGADDHAQRVGADHVAHLGQGRAQVVGHHGQDAHGGEFARADGEAADGQGQVGVSSAKRRGDARNQWVYGGVHVLVSWVRM